MCRLRDMLFGLRISVLLCEAEIDHVDRLRFDTPAHTHTEVLRLQVTVDVVLTVQGLDTAELHKRLLFLLTNWSAMFKTVKTENHLPGVDFIKSSRLSPRSSMTIRL